MIEAVLFKEVDIQPSPQGKDRYARIVVIVEIPDVGVLQSMLLKAGLAWVYPQYCKDCEDWKEMQVKVKEQDKGLWEGYEPVPLWEWRRRR